MWVRVRVGDSEIGLSGMVVSDGRISMVISEEVVVMFVPLCMYRWVDESIGLDVIVNVAGMVLNNVCVGVAWKVSECVDVLIKDVSVDVVLMT